MRTRPGPRCAGCSSGRCKTRLPSGGRGGVRRRKTTTEPGRCEHMAELDRAAIQNVFEELVNMAPAELESWLDTDESRKVGWKGADGKRSESVGHANGRRIVGILRMNKAA